MFYVMKKETFLTLAMNFFCLPVCLFMMVMLPGCIQSTYQPYGTAPSRPVYRQTEYQVNTTNTKYSDKTFDMELVPFKEDDHYRGFTLSIKNKTKGDLKLIWNDSYFVENESAKGGFMFEGIVYSKRTEAKQDLMILPQASVSINIFPNDKVLYLSHNRSGSSMGLPSGWVHGVMSGGTFGAYLLVKGKNFEQRVKLTAEINER